MGLLDMLFGGDGQPQQNSLPMEELRQLGLSDGLINYYQQEQAKAQKQAMWNNAINGVANIASSAQGNGPRFGGGSDGGGGSGGPGANTPLSLDGLVDRALKFSQIRDSMSKRQQAAAARAAIPALAQALGVPNDVVAAMDPADLSEMYQQMRQNELQAQLPIRKQDAEFDAAGIPLEQRQAIRRRAYDVKPELTTIEDGSGNKASVFKVPNAANPNGYDLLGLDGKPYGGPQPKWKLETIKTPGGDFSVAVRPNAQSPSGFDIVDPVDGSPVDIAQLQQRSLAAASEKKAAETKAVNVTEKQAGLSRALNGIDEFSSAVEDVLNDPSIENYVGNWWGQATSNISGSDAADAAAKINELKAKAFLIGAQSLKGQGNLTESEGAKVEAAIGRLDPKQKPEQFRKALKEVAVSLQRLRQIALEEAGGQLQSRPQSPTTPSNDWQSLGSVGRIRRVN